MATPAQLKANQKYIESRDDIKIRPEKGKKEIYQAWAKSKGMSLNAYIISLIEKDMERD